MFKLLRKRIRLTRAHKGFTLTELIVVVALIAIIMLSVVAFSGPIRTMTKNATARAETLTINEVISNFIQNKISYANYMKIYAGCDYSATNSRLSSEFGSLVTKASDSKNRPGMLVFHFEPDNSTPSYKGTMKIYDVPVTSSSTMPAVIASTTTPPDPRDGQLDEKYQAFVDEFYDGYEFFVDITANTVNVNNQSKRAFFDLMINAYNFKGDYSAAGFQSADITAHYNKLDNPGSAVVDTMPTFDNEKIASQSLSFTMPNINIKNNWTQYDSNGDGVIDTSDDYKLVSEPEDVKIERGTVPTAGGSRSYGADIVIFYNVRTYDY